MKLGIILETKEAEKSWNAFRFAIAALKKGNSVKMFLLGEAVECENIEDKEHDTPTLMKEYKANGGEILACGTCIKARHLEDTTSCPISTMNDCVDIVEWSDKMVTF
ncbi:DsrE family protein [Companilactobacillus allii]|uniref:DsrE family protein n=1 Tax=Companilactobacillus allii TaxID=1847728 RepID=A0A1P8Q2R9_9LACO|nr:DsrE family protein [Companilactobacillus allii]APX72172.1 DsrE family protein [Companilactobacillus allii]USQ69269.1 DsrE family protein [Companilactobacillus allii]